MIPTKTTTKIMQPEQTIPPLHSPMINEYSQYTVKDGTEGDGGLKITKQIESEFPGINVVMTQGDEDSLVTGPDWRVAYQIGYWVANNWPSL